MKSCTGRDPGGRDGIAPWRDRIDELDARLIGILNERARCAIEIGKIKRDRGLPIYDPEREEGIVRMMIEMNAGPLDATGIRRVFERIIDESRRIERVTAEGEAHPPVGGAGPQE
jgi:chorismate mutase